jgi:hypothetical protein
MQLLFCPQDNLNTDGIYAGKYTYRDGMSPAEMAAVAMDNYDPNFQRLVKPVRGQAGHRDLHAQPPHAPTHTHTQ